MGSTLYNIGVVVNPGGNFINGSYRMYSTNTTGSGFYYDGNDINSVYFKGNTIT